MAQVFNELLKEERVSSDIVEMCPLCLAWCEEIISTGSDRILVLKPRGAVC